MPRYDRPNAYERSAQRELTIRRLASASASRISGAASFSARAWRACWLCRAPARGRAAHRHHPRQGRADADRDPALSPARPVRRQVGRSIAEVVAADLERSGLFRAARPPRLHPDARVAARRAALRRLAADQRPGAGHRHGADRRATAGSGSSSGCGTCSPSSSCAGFAYTTTPAATGAASPTSSPTRSTSGITGEDGYFDTRIVYIAEIRAGTDSGSSASRSWTRTAPTISFLTDGSAWC